MQISFNEVANQLLVMLIVIALGYIAKKKNILNENGDGILSALVVNITSPFLIVYSMSNSFGAKGLKDAVIIAVVSICILLFSWAISKIIVLFKFYTKDEQIIYRLSIIFSNASYVGFPLCYGLFGEKGLFYACIYSSVQDIFFWSAGVAVTTGKAGSAKLKGLINPNIIAILAGVVLILSGIKLPDFAQNAFSTVGNATIPLALMLVGSGFCNATLKLSSAKKVILPCLIKLVAVPAIVGIALLPVNMEPVIKGVLMIEISMPCAASIVVLAKNYGRDYGIASAIVMIMTVLSIITIPLLVFVIGSI